MPPGEWSRYLFCWGLKNAETDEIGLSEREPFGYQDLPDNRYYTVAQGDTLHTIAERAFPSLPNPCQLFWVIADFQQDPIQDATLLLEVGRELVIPSEMAVRTLVFDERRRGEFAG
jgi:hypothetical protein